MWATRSIQKELNDILSMGRWCLCWTNM